MKKNCILFLFLMIINLSVISQNANDYYTTAIGNIKNENYELALTNLNKAVELNPNYKEAYFSRGFVYHTTNKFEQAIKEYNKAVELKFTGVELNYYRGLAYYDLDNYDKALADFNKALETPDNKFILIYMKRADIYYLSKKYDLAIIDFNKITEIAKNDYYSYFLKSAASLKISGDNYSKAVEEIKKIKDKIEESWQKAIASFLTGSISADKFIAEAKNENNKISKALIIINKSLNFMHKGRLPSSPQFEEFVICTL